MSIHQTLVELRTKFLAREKELIARRNFLAEHNFHFEAARIQELKTQLELQRFDLENAMDELGAKY